MYYPQPLNLVFDPLIMSEASMPIISPVVVNDTTLTLLLFHKSKTLSLSGMFSSWLISKLCLPFENRLFISLFAI